MSIEEKGSVKNGDDDRKVRQRVAETALRDWGHSLAAWEKVVGTVVDDPRAWLNRPNPQFRGKRPIDLIGTDEEPVLRAVIEAAKQGAFS